MVKAGAIVWVPDGGGQTEIVADPGLIYSGRDDAVARILASSASRRARPLCGGHLEARAAVFSSARFVAGMRAVVRDFLTERTGPRRIRSPSSSRPRTGRRSSAACGGACFARAGSPTRSSSSTRAPGRRPRSAGERGRPVLRVIRTAVASATRQRNLGLDAVGPDATLVGFLDDDAVLEDDAVEEMLRFWALAGPEVGGAAFNMANHPPLDWPVLKRTPPRGEPWPLLRPRRPGDGLRVPDDDRSCRHHGVDRLAAERGLGLATRGLRRFRFDEWFDGYSYLEDLDFSYRVGRTSKLAVVAPARYLHLPAAGGRGGGYAFGVREVLNRIHFVKKYPELSLGQVPRRPDR